jgi:hypothetical protein
MAADDNDSALASREKRSLIKAALLVIEVKGDRAMEYARQRATVLRRKGDETGAEAWLRVAPVIAELKEGSRERELAESGGLIGECQRRSDQQK